jgi:glycosyltransferase involved in cell wall biosynthesis
MTKILTVMSCHNAEATVRRAAESVLLQDGWLLAVNDGSKDRTGDILWGLQAKHPRLLIRENPKQADWQEAMAFAVELTSYTTATHILGMGADDYLLPGWIDAFEKQDADIIWADYYFTNWRGQAVNVSTSGMVSPDYVDGEGVQDMFADADNPFQAAWRPSGVACAVRRDLWLDMMLGKKAYELGPHSDTIALNLLACQRGATFIPQKLAAFTLRHKDGKKGYSQASNAGGERPMYYERACEYIDKHKGNVSSDACHGILRKWFPDLHK